MWLEGHPLVAPSSFTGGRVAATRSTASSSSTALEPRPEPELLEPALVAADWRRHYETLTMRRRIAHAKPSALHPRIPHRWRHLGLEDDDDDDVVGGRDE